MGGKPSAPLPNSNLLTVTVNGTDHAVLAFDEDIALVGDPSSGAFAIEGLSIVSFSKTGAREITLVFNDVVDGGLIWNLNSGNWVSPNANMTSGETA